MTKEKKNTFTIILFIIYMLLLIWIILFKLQFSLNNFDRVRGINLIPFQGSVIVNGVIKLDEIFYNIFVFVPLGIYTCMLKGKWPVKLKVLFAFCISLSFEVLQFIFAIGRTDITDLIGNTLGGIVGIGIYTLLFKLLKKHTIKVINILALIVTVCTISFIALLLIINR